MGENTKFRRKICIYLKIDQGQTKCDVRQIITYVSRKCKTLTMVTRRNEFWECQIIFCFLLIFPFPLTHYFFRSSSPLLFKTSVHFFLCSQSYHFLQLPEYLRNITICLCKIVKSCEGVKNLMSNSILSILITSSFHM